MHKQVHDVVGKKSWLYVSERFLKLRTVKHFHSHCFIAFIFVKSSNNPQRTENILSEFSQGEDTAHIKKIKVG